MNFLINKKTIFCKVSGPEIYIIVHFQVLYSDANYEVCNRAEFTAEKSTIYHYIYIYIYIDD